MAKNTTKSNILKPQLIKALEKSLGIVSIACAKVKIARSTFYAWVAEDNEFKKQVDSIENLAIDMVESQLHKQIKDGVPSSTIFYLKTKGKKRGYQEIESTKSVINYNVEVSKDEARKISKDLEDEY